MLTLYVPAIDMFDDANQRFIKTEPVVLELEHSLVSLSKWESIFQKPFLGPDKKSKEETLGYIKATILTQEFPEDVVTWFSQKNFDDFNDYISSKMTATWFHELPGTSKSSGEVITSELIYYWMTVLNVPFECETWHLNRLLTLIKVISEKNAPKKKMPRREVQSQQRALNEARRRESATRG